MNALMESVAYGMLDVATAGRGIRRRIGGELIRLPVRWSRFYSPDHGADAVAVLRARCQPGYVTMDIGAHLGLFSVAMARLVGPTGRVFSFEPTDRVRDVLEQTVRLNRCAEIVEIHREAVGGGTSPVTRYYDTGDPLSRANGLVRTAECRTTTVVPMVTVDDFIARRGISVQFLRIDAAGAELDVLRGAVRTLATCRPSALVSLHPQVARHDGAGVAEIWDVLRDCKMSVLLRGHRLNRRDFRHNEGPFDVELMPEETLPPYDPCEGM